MYRRLKAGIAAISIQLDFTPEETLATRLIGKFILFGTFPPWWRRTLNNKCQYSSKVRDVEIMAEQ